MYPVLRESPETEFEVFRDCDEAMEWAKNAST